MKNLQFLLALMCFSAVSFADGKGPKVTGAVPAKQGLPPMEAQEACRGKKTDTECSFGKVTGKCWKPEMANAPMACKPAAPPPPPPPAPDKR